MFNHITKHQKVRQNACRIFNSLRILDVWKCSQTRSFVYDVILGVNG